MPEFTPITLTPEQQRIMEQLGQNVKFVDSELRRAKTAGLDVADLEKTFTEAKKLREGVLRVYGK